MTTEDSEHIVTGDTITLDLPEPPAQIGGRSKHWRGKWAKVNAYKQAVWQAAIQQHPPFPDPPTRVRMSLHYRLWNARELVNLYADCKPLIDSLKQVPSGGDRMRWRQGVWMARGYFYDDDGVEFGIVTQEIDRKRRGVTVTLEVLEEAA